MTQRIEKQLKARTAILDVINAWLDKKPTGMLKLEIHAAEGGISKVYKDNREEVSLE